MDLRDLLLTHLEREVDRSRRVLQYVPDGKYDWKPHDRSMKFGYLADLVASIPFWIAAIVTDDDLDVAPTGDSKMRSDKKTTSGALLKALDASAAAARAALETTTDAHLLRTWLLKERGEIVQQAPRVEMIQDTVAHWAHHRGQMTVYLRLMGSMVPAVYGPSADEHSFR